MSSAAFEALDELFAGDTDADDVLRGIVEVLVNSGGCAWAAIRFSEDGQLVPGPHAGTADEGASASETPVDFQGANIAQLATTGCDDEEFLVRVAALIAPYCLVGWDTGGVPWDAAEN